MKSDRRGELGISLIVLSWGINYVVTKIGVAQLSPVDFVFWRFVGTALFALPWTLRKRPRGRREWLGIVVMGLVGVSLYQWLFSTALNLTLSANVAFIFNLSPLLTLLWQRVVQRRVMGQHIWWGAALSFAGVALLARASLHGGGYLGDVFALGAAASWSAFALITDHFRVSVTGLAQTGWISLIGALGLLPFVNFAAPWQAGGSTVWPLLYTIIFVTLMGLSLWQTAVASLGAGRASLMLYIIPLVAAVAGWVFLGERLGILEGVGAVAILAGVAWADGRFMRQKSGPMEPPAAEESV
ncbi:DMT family transporter [Sulfobacillus harzensis]|uniref:EamA family transporter n=1 Tax=Sulfobacillus harzensis TaxID=2729629 RepID=A0A7Y0L3M3_9FIRM|nr:EamA family transporter [Sulfobacillus harzensis]NMP22686.1 EamA family transporter [Sulfobacillus harzensis]